ncbi:hypothetical protein D3C72_1976100 [compost metagenome]
MHELAVVHHGADVGASLAGVVHLQGLHFLDHGGHEAVVDAFGHDQAAAGSAALAGREEPAVDGGAHGHVQVGVVQHHKRVLAAHLQLHLGTARHAGGGHTLSRAHRSGEAHARNALVFQQHGAHLRAPAHDQVEHTGRQP